MNQQAKRPTTYTEFLGNLGTSLDLYFTNQRDLYNTVMDLRKDVEGLRETIASLTEHMNTLDGRFTKVLEKSHEEHHPDALQADHITHHENIVHDIESLYDKLWNTIQSELSHATPWNKADFMKRAIEELFVAEIPHLSILERIRTPHGQKDKQIKDFVGHATNIREKVSLLGDNPRFVFEFVSGGVITAEAQKAWRGCNPEGLAEFVVTPGYQVGHRILMPQQVYTSDTNASPEVSKHSQN